MIDVSELMDDPEFCTDFQLRRISGAFQDEGEWVNGSPVILERLGAIHPASASQLKLLPEGERRDFTIAVYSDQDILMADGTGIQSDVVIWKGKTFRVAYSKDWSDNGYWFALAVEFSDEPLAEPDDA